MIPFQKSIGFRLLGISFILLALPLLVDSFILIRERYENTIASAKAFLVETANFREIPFSQLQPVNRPLMDLLVKHLDLVDHFPQQGSAELNTKLKEIAQVGDFYGAFLLKITPEGKHIVIDSGLPSFIGKDYTDFFKLHHYYIPAKQEGNVMSFVSFDSETLLPYYIVSEAIYSPKEKRYIGAFAVSKDFSQKLETLLTPEKKPYRVDFALMLPSTVVFAASDPTLKFNYFLPLKPGYRELFEREEPLAAKHVPPNPLPVKTEMGFPFFEFTWNGETQVGYIRNLPSANLALLVYAAKQDVFQTPLISFFDIYSVYGLILVVGGTLVTLITMRMARPIQNLSLVMQKIQEGDLRYRYQKDPLGFEINALGDIFNEMVDAVLEQKQVAEEERVKRETFAQELRLGQQAQMSLLPQTMPKYPGVDLAEMYIPAIEVGGDFYDVFVKDETEKPQLALAVADASGKGVQACFYSLNLRNILRTYTLENQDIAQAMAATNDLFRTETGDTGMFVTVLAGLYDYRTHNLSYYSCGHNPGFVRRADGKVEMLKFEGMAMGILPSKPVSAHNIALQKGDTVFFYTDGITEALNEEHKFFGEARLRDTIQRVDNKTAEEMVRMIVREVSAFVGSAPQHDDITLLVMKITE